PKEKKIDQSNLLFFVQENIIWSKIKQTHTVPVGNELSMNFKFYIPTGIGLIGKNFSFTGNIEEKYYYKFYKEFFFKFRSILSLNYNNSNDYSHHLFVRGIKNNENTGFFNFITNLEMYFPVVDINMWGSASISFTTLAKFVLYLNIFVDFGLSIDNFDYYLENSLIRDFYPDKNSNYPFYYITDNYYFTPILTVGGGLRIYTYFLPFIIRVDVGVNLLKAIIKQDPTVDVIISFNDMF
ncbi:MAG TPA: hypothetical protein PK771_01210, partial [Spirochaetota bacterium]|nr:hypothetical protein [Spirochaetota bacterium]